jgi:hypothetical protein
MSHFICEKEVGTCGRKEKQQNKIGQNLNLGRRRNEKRRAKRKSLPDLNANDPDKLCVRYAQMLPLR